MNFPALLSLLTMLPLPARLSARRRYSLRRRQPRPVEEEALEADRPLGCGWFDSSLELQLGLVVHEDPTPERLAAELPLASWLDLALCGWRADGALQATSEAGGAGFSA